MKTEQKKPIRRKLFTVLVMILLLSSAGCLSHRAHFRPGGADPYAKADQAGAYQQLDLDGKTIGNAKIWSQGIFKHSEGSTLVMHVGMRIKNDAKEEFILDLENTQLEAQTEDGQAIVLNTVSEMVGSDRVPAGVRTRIELLYALPEQLKSSDIRLFELNWTIKLNERRLSLSTPFFRDPHRRRVYIAAPYWGGFYPWYPFWLSYPFWFYPRWWSFSYGFSYHHWYPWRISYPAYWYRYPRYYYRAPHRHVYVKPTHRYLPRRKRK